METSSHLQGHMKKNEKHPFDKICAKRVKIFSSPSPLEPSYTKFILTVVVIVICIQFIRLIAISLFSYFFLILLLTIDPARVARHFFIKREVTSKCPQVICYTLIESFFFSFLALKLM